jgi:hypothetical protein
MAWRATAALSWSAGRVGVEAQAVASSPSSARIASQHLRGGRVGVFVGVELDQVGELGLLAGNVGGQVVDDGAPEAAHGKSARRRVAARDGENAKCYHGPSVRPFAWKTPCGKPKSPAIPWRRRSPSARPRWQRQGQARHRRPFLDHMLDQIARHGTDRPRDRMPRATCTSTPTTRSRMSASPRPGLCEGRRRQEGPDPLRPRLRAARRGPVARGGRSVRPPRAGVQRRVHACA